MALDTYYILTPDGGQQLRFLGASVMRLKNDGTDSEGRVAFYEYLSDPGTAGPPQHVHHGHDETFYVVEGNFEFGLGATTVQADPGAFLSLPRGTPHTFWNRGTTPGRIVGTFSPARFAEYFKELAEIIDKTGRAPDLQVWAELYGRYDTTFYESVR